MTAHALIEQARSLGVTLSVEGGRLLWAADHEPPADLMEILKAHRLTLQDELAAEHEVMSVDHQHERYADWLNELANLLECDPEYLFKQGFIEEHDLCECCTFEPIECASLIRTNPLWQSLPKPEKRDKNTDFCEQYAHAREEQSVWDENRRQWEPARDELFSHAYGNCPDCNPRFKRYCPTGQALHERYQETIR